MLSRTTGAAVPAARTDGAGGAAAPAGPGASTYRAALAGREFRALLAGATIGICGQVIAAVALTVEVYDRTRSPLLSSLTFALGFLPYLFGGTLLSALVDRVPPRTLLTISALGAAGLTATMALPGLPVLVLLGLLVITGTLTSVASGAQGGLVRSVVPAGSYVPARSLLRITAQVAQIVGNAFGGAALVLLTVPGAFLAGAAALAAAAVTLRLGLRDHRVSGAAGVPLLLDSLRGVREVLGHARLRRLLLLGWLVPMFAVAPESLGAPYVAGQGGSTALVGWWLAMLPIGLVVGDLLGMLTLSPARQRSLTGLAAAAYFLPYLVFLARPPVAVALPLLAGAGLCGMYSLGLDALIRAAVPDQLFARAMAVNSAGLLTVQGAGFALAGAVAQVTGPAWAIAIAGAGGLITVALLRPRGGTAERPQRERPQPERNRAL